MAKLKHISDQQFCEYVKSSTSYRQLAIKLNMRGGSSQPTIRKKVIQLNLDDSHFTGQTWNKNKISHHPDHVLSNRSKFSCHYVKKILIKEKNIPLICNECKISSWNGKVIVLELDHINGISNDNRIENLRLLCPNCHSQTPTFRGRNLNKGNTKVSNEKLLSALKECKTFAAALTKVGLAPKGGNYKRCYELLAKNKI